MILRDVTFGVDEGDKIALIARNGTGKTTLLRILAGQEDYDSGKITYRRDLRVAYLPQTPIFTPGQTALEACLGPDVDPLKAEQMLATLGISDYQATVDTMSGGQLKRVAIAQVLLSEPQLLLLDEPTNHLDIQVIEWLETYLSRSRITLLLVTHDRYFLDRVCNKIIEIDLEQVFVYDGNYDYYLRRRAERIEALSAELDRVRNTLRRETDWMRRQPQARAGKAQYRIDAYYDLRERSQAKVTSTTSTVNLDVASSYIGNKIFEASHISKAYGDKKILDDFSYVFARYEKVGIIGPNGVGKSTFIKMLQGLVAPDSGHWDVGTTVRFGYYSQEGIAFDERKKVIDAITEIAEDVVVNDHHLTPMQFLTRFMFTPADQQKYIHTLSGGERCRLQLAAVLMRSPNFLILDEPTNDLDIVTLGVLEDYLEKFKGCVIVVSHDRFFLDSIVDHLFVMEGDGAVKDFPGGYSDYRAWLKERQQSSTPKTQDVPREVPAKPRTDRAPKLTFKERQEFTALTAEIEALEQEKREIELLFQQGASGAEIAQASQRYEAIKALLDEKEMRWLELSEKDV